MVELVDGFVPAQGDQFHRMGWESVVGVFDQVDLPGLRNPKLKWRVECGSDGLYLTVVSRLGSDDIG